MRLKFFNRKGEKTRGGANKINHSKHDIFEESFRDVIRAFKLVELISKI